MPAYDFRCPQCSRVYEVRIKLSEYDAKKASMICWQQSAEKYDPPCEGTLVRMMDFKGHFELTGSGWFGKDGQGTGYEITQTEMNQNLEESARMADMAQDLMATTPPPDEGE